MVGIWLSTYGLSQQLGIKPGEAESLKRQYFATFGKVHGVFGVVGFFGS